MLKTKKTKRMISCWSFVLNLTGEPEKKLELCNLQRVLRVICFSHDGKKLCFWWSKTCWKDNTSQPFHVKTELRKKLFIKPTIRKNGYLGFFLDVSDLKGLLNKFFFTITISEAVFGQKTRSSRKHDFFTRGWVWWYGFMSQKV